MPPIPADLQQNIFITIYLTIAHNYAALFYFFGLIAAAIWAFYKPSRPLILAMAGFALLLFAFEYNKHIEEALKLQTLNAMITEQPHYKAERLLDIFFNKFVPLAVPLAGWICLGTAAFLGYKNRSHKHHKI